MFLSYSHVRQRGQGHDTGFGPIISKRNRNAKEAPFPLTKHNNLVLLKPILQRQAANTTLPYPSKGSRNAPDGGLRRRPQECLGTGHAGGCPIGASVKI